MKRLAGIIFWTFCWVNLGWADPYFAPHPGSDPPGRPAISQGFDAFRQAMHGFLDRVQVFGSLERSSPLKRASTWAGRPAAGRTGTDELSPQADEADFLLFLPAMAKPKRYLLITPAQLALLKQKVLSNAPEWVTLKTNVDAEMGIIDPTPEDNFYRCSPENIALVYLLTREPKYAAAALTWARESMKLDVRFDSYLEFGEDMRRVALVLNYCWDALTPIQRTELSSYLDTWTYELWFNNQGSGWGLNDPGNNYHMAFLEGTAFAGYALREAGHPNAGTYLGVLFDKLNRSGGVMDYVNTRTLGGDWVEGVNYGERSKQRLYAALSVIASMTGDNYFSRSPFFANSIYYAHYQLQPGNVYIYPGGDLARISTMPVSPYERDYMQVAVYWLPDSDARRYGQWYLEHVVPSYDEPEGVSWRWLYYKDMIYQLSLPAMAQNTLPLSYRAAATEWVNFRSGWDAGATCVSLSGSPIIDQSHQHHDTGSFTIWKQDWLALDASTLSHSGLLWEPGAHNMLQVAGSERRDVPGVPGLTRYWDETLFAYVQVNGTHLFRQRGEEEDILLLNEWTREFVYLKPDTAVLYDRVNPKPGSVYDLRFHFPVQPVLASGRYTAGYHGGGISLLPLVSGAITMHQDTDLGDPPGSTAWRVQELPTTPAAGRFLNVLQVASGTPPALTALHVTTTSGMEGALWNTDVVLFSTQALGAPPALPFSYTLPGTAPRTHTLLNMAGSFDVVATWAGGQTTVTVSPGTTYTANSQGVLRFTQ